jgi:transcriptional regulator with XRE-family HTH domain
MKTMKTTKKKRASTGPKCECGGSFKPATLNNFDFTSYAGIPSFLDGVPGWKCGSCHREMLRGDVINASLVMIMLDLVTLPHRLSAEFARYLRRSIQITQQELADRMGVDRVTVANWENGLKEISPQHDLILRILIVNHARGSEALPTKVIVDLANEVMSSLSAVKSEPPRNVPNLRVTESDYKKLPSAVLSKMQTVSMARAS